MWTCPLRCPGSAPQYELRTSLRSPMSVIERNNVHLQGSGDRAMVFAHGFGCDQNMWRFVAPEFEKGFRVVLFDHVGAGGSDLSAYEPRKYSTVSGYADDVVE